MGRTSGGRSNDGRHGIWRFLVRLNFHGVAWWNGLVVFHTFAHRSLDYGVFTSFWAEMADFGATSPSDFRPSEPSSDAAVRNANTYSSVSVRQVNRLGHSSQRSW